MVQITPEVERAEAERKVREALRHVEAAQRELELACQELCPVIGALPDWERIGKLRDRVNAQWHRLNEVRPRSGYRLDEDGRRALAKALGLAGQERP